MQSTCSIKPRNNPKIGIYVDFSISERLGIYEALEGGFCNNRQATIIWGNCSIVVVLNLGRTLEITQEIFTISAQATDQTKDINISGVNFFLLNFPSDSGVRQGWESLRRKPIRSAE